MCLHGSVMATTKYNHPFYVYTVYLFKMNDKLIVWVCLWRKGLGWRQKQTRTIGREGDLLGMYHYGKNFKYLIFLDLAFMAVPDFLPNSNAGLLH
jgi:hypothetical protein